MEGESAQDGRSGGAKCYYDQHLLHYQHSGWMSPSCQYQAFSTFLGNQLGNTIMVGDIQARLWVVVVGCSCGMGVYCGSQCLERGKGWSEGFRFAGEEQLQGVAVLEQLNTSGVGGEMADQNSTTGWQQVGSSVPGWVYF